MRPQPAPPIDVAEDQRRAERIAALVDGSRPKLVDGPQPHNHATAELPLD